VFYKMLFIPVMAKLMAWS